MYEKFWHLKEKPFQNTPDPRYLFLSRQHEDVLMKLTYVIAQGLGSGMLTGVFGCGKTLVSRVVMRDLGEDRFRWAHVHNPSLGEPAELLRAVVRSLSPQELPERKTEILVDPLLEKLHTILTENVRDGKENVIIIDEAHTIDDPKIFEQLRLMLNFQTEKKFLLTLLILGQPELKAKVDAIKSLSQRIPVRCHLGPLNKEEIDNYITHRIEVAREDMVVGEDAQISFSSEVLKLIFDHTGGIPRKINTLCDFLFLSGFAKKKNAIGPDLIHSVIKEFNLT